MVALVGGAAAPRQAQACSPPEETYCTDFFEFQPLVGTVAPGGVLVFSFERASFYGTLTHALDFIDVQVTGPDGPLAGTLEADDAMNTMLWRPEVPFVAGAELEVAIAIDNAGINGNDAKRCESSELTGTHAIVVGDTPVPATPEFTVSFEETYLLSPAVRLDSLVCCDDTYPVDDDCGGPVIEGYCASTIGEGRLTVGAAVAWPDVPELAALYVPRLVLGGSTALGTPGSSLLSRSLLAADCGHVEVVDLVTGTVTLDAEQCFGEAYEGQLGDVAIDPTDDLAANCEGVPYVCDVDGNGWDPEACSPFASEGGEDSSGGDEGGSEGEGGSEEGGDSTPNGPAQGDEAQGCGCTTGSGRGGWAWAWLPLLALRRRRHRRT